MKLHLCSLLAASLLAACGASPTATSLLAPTTAPTATRPPSTPTAIQPTATPSQVPPTATALPTQTPEPTSTSTSTSTPRPTATPAPTNTPRPTVPPPPTFTPRPTSPPVPTAPPVPTVPPTVAPTPKPTTPPAVTFGDGIRIVGQDIPAGTYRTRGGSTCYWERLSGFGGTLGEIVANENTNGPAVVTLAGFDKGFRASRCGIWTQDLSPITASPVSPFGSGTYIVNRDISSGRWRSDGTGSCYWERLRNFSGTLDGIIANDNVTGSAIVDIGAGDAGFNSSRCGTWTKIG